MFNITGHQMMQFENKALQDFVKRACAHLRKIYGDDLKDVSDGDLKTFSETGVERARTFDLVSEREVVEFLSFSVVFGAEFPESEKTPWAKEILLSHHTGKQRIEALHKRAEYFLRSKV